MASPAYLEIEGSNQGLITQGVGIQEKHEDEILVQAFEHMVSVPTDNQTGMPTGQRVHKPMIITKVFDKCSPLLYLALTSAERLNKCKMRFWCPDPDGSGTQVHFFTIELVDAVVTNIKSHMPNCLDPKYANNPHLLEDVSFTYRQITWTNELSGTTGTDAWDQPEL